MSVNANDPMLTEKRLTDTRRAIKEEMRYIQEARHEALAYSHLGNALQVTPDNKAQARLYTLAVEALHERISSAYARLGARFSDLIEMGGLNELFPELAEFAQSETAGTVLSLLHNSLNGAKT